MIKLLYAKDCIWEFDFIINDALMDISLDIEYFETKDILKLIERPELIENCIIVINIYAYKNYNDTLNTIKYLKPLIIFYLSDETGLEPETELEKYTKLFFRQYNFPKYNYANYSYQLPLGYPNKYLIGQRTLDITPKTKKMDERIYNCSFIGSMKSDRQHMINVFTNNMEKTNIKIVNNPWIIDKLPISPQESFDIYNNSKFIPVGRGNVSLDCFRIYEAIIAGAIPIIVGSQTEIKNTFNFNSEIPPIIYAESWENAVAICNSLLLQPNELQNLQNNLIIWWHNQITFINQTIKSLLPEHHL